MTRKRLIRRKTKQPINLWGLFNAKAILVEEQLWYNLKQICDDNGVYTFTQWYLSESERNSMTGDRTHLLRCRSPARKPLHHRDYLQ